MGWGRDKAGPVSLLQRFQSFGYSVPKLMNRSPCLDTVVVTEVIPSGSAASGPGVGALEEEGVTLVNQYQAHNFTYTISLDSDTNPVRQWP